MTQDELDVEYKKFLEAFPDREAIPKVTGFAYPQCIGWMRRAESAIAEQEELRERIKELAKWKLKFLLSDCPAGAHVLWKAANTDLTDTLLVLAEEAGCWYDDNGNEVPLDKWRAKSPLFVEYSE